MQNNHFWAGCAEWKKGLKRQGYFLRASTLSLFLLPFLSLSSAVSLSLSLSLSLSFFISSQILSLRVEIIHLVLLKHAKFQILDPAARNDFGLQPFKQKWTNKTKFVFLLPIMLQQQNEKYLEKCKKCCSTNGFSTV